ncbi:MAG: hypothetical protein AAF891_04225 [Pseudomonadota bacterium]
MNTGISRSRLSLPVVAALSCLALTGCVAGGFSFASGEGEITGVQIGPVVAKSKETKLAQGAVTVKAPKNYCIDDASVTNGLTGSSVRIAKCTALDGKGGAAATSAVMTVRVSPRRTAEAPVPTTDDLAAAVAPAEILASQQKGSLALVHVASGGDDAFKPADPRHWRGATALDTRLVLLSLYAPKGAPMAGGKGADLLTSLARGISVTRGGFLGLTAQPDDASKAADDEAGAATPPLDEALPENDVGKKGLAKALGRLFNRS